MSNLETTIRNRFGMVSGALYIFRNGICFFERVERPDALTRTRVLKMYAPPSESFDEAAAALNLSQKLLGRTEVKGAIFDAD